MNYSRNKPPSSYNATTNSDYGRNGFIKADAKPVYRPPSGSRPLPANGRGPLDVNGKLITASKLIESHTTGRTVTRQPVRADHSIPTSTQRHNGESSSRQDSGRIRTLSHSDGNDYSLTSSSLTNSRRHGSSTNLNVDNSSSRATLTRVDAARSKATLQRNASLSSLHSYGSNSNIRHSYDDRNSNGMRSNGVEMLPRNHALPGGTDEAIRESPVVCRRSQKDSFDRSDDSNGLDSSRSSKAELRTPRSDLPKLHVIGRDRSTATAQQYDDEPQYKPSFNGTTDKLKDLSIVSSKGTLQRRPSLESTNTNNNIGSGLVGLQNIGNTCFMNSILQCLSNTKMLRDVLLMDGYESMLNSQKCAVVQEYASLLRKLWKTQSSSRHHSYENPSNVKQAIKTVTSRFEGYSQHDAQEFLTYLLEGLHDGLNRVKDKPRRQSVAEDDRESREDKARKMWHVYLRRDNSIIIDLFVGQLHSCLVCDECKHSSHAFDPFWSLPLPIPQSSFRSRNVDLKDCFELFTQEETLDGDERPICSKCKKRVRATKRFKIQKFPQILIIHLKRFREGSYRSKLDTNISFPCDGLDLSKFAADAGVRVTYNLYAVSNHTGSTYGGHYTADCKHPDTRVWHHYNDSIVSDLSPKSLRESEAYILFYEMARG